MVLKMVMIVKMMVTVTVLRRKSVTLVMAGMKVLEMVIMVSVGTAGGVAR